MAITNSTYAQLYDTSYDGRIPAGLDAQQLLTCFDAQIPWVVSGTLQQEAVLAGVHRLRFLNDAEHCLVHFVGHQRFGETGHV